LTLLLIKILMSSCSELKTIQKYGLKPPTIEIKGDKAYVNGTLGITFYDLFVETLNKHPELKTIVLLDIPGSVNDEWNLKSCLLLNKKGLNTELLNNSIVESGGTDLFVSGKKLIIADGAKIGVHSWAGGKKSATDYPKGHKEHKMFLDLYKSVDVDTSFYWFTLQAAPADGMHFMTKDEIFKYLGNKTN
ncbi:hypothetical protein N9E56_01375, partial [Flavobacteriaceae bacterium]|nr:hypothetical protein [Flavobacteriaceae bacterium]